MHRDLKPENILITRDGVVKVMDFGIARLMDSRLTATGQLLGTPAYMSPEQAQGRPADARSDIYSLGLVIYELFCGRPRVLGRDAGRARRQARGRGAGSRRADRSRPAAAIDAAIRRCLEKHPGARFQSMVELEAALSGGIRFRLIRRCRVPPARCRQLSAGGAPTGSCWRAGGRRDRLPFAFARVSLAPRSQVTFDRPVLRRIAADHLQRLGVPATQVGRGWRPRPGRLRLSGENYGAAAARDPANNPVHYWTWRPSRAERSNWTRGRLASFPALSD